MPLPDIKELALLGLKGESFRDIEEGRSERSGRIFLTSQDLSWYFDTGLH
jgi:hypothetical protein